MEPLSTTSTYEEVLETLRAEPRSFLVTGAAGFIGSHLTETLLGLGQRVVGLDNFFSGTPGNLSDVLDRVGPRGAERFRLVRGDIRDAEACSEAARGADVILHQAALASVPRSIEDPASYYAVNVDGMANVLEAARVRGVKRVVYASSSSVYGTDESSIKTEERISRPLSPYAATKLVGEIRAAAFARAHHMQTVGLRYFNVFGPRQNPNGAYAAVIPKWIQGLLRGEPCVVFGDGSASRDFSYVDNVVQANLLAACAKESSLFYDVFNVGNGGKLTLLGLFDAIRSGVVVFRPECKSVTLRFEPPRAGDIPHSCASVARISKCLGYHPLYDVWRGLGKTISWCALRGPEARKPEDRSVSSVIVPESEPA